jgi:hypothetical protein
LSSESRVPGRSRTPTILITIGTLVGGLAAAAAAYYSYRSWQLSKGTVARSTASFTEPATLRRHDCDTSVSEAGLQVSGTANLKHDDELWLLIQAPGIGRFYLPSTKPLKVSHGNGANRCPISTRPRTPDRVSRSLQSLPTWMRRTRSFVRRKRITRARTPRTLTHCRLVHLTRGGPALSERNRRRCRRLSVPGTALPATSRSTTMASRT